jgi:D-3-phosphoglycerate dehydrogenase
MPNLDALLRQSDFITLHVPAIDATKDMINSESISRMKPGMKLLNFAREEIVNSKDVAQALNDGAMKRYVTDFPVPELIGNPKAILMPHIGASTTEAEDNCAVMAADQLIDFLENGNIKNSTNFPNTSMPRGSDYRITVANQNVPNVLGSILALIAGIGANVVDLVNQSRGEIAYNIIDIDQPVTPDILRDLGGLEGVVTVRSL